MEIKKIISFECDENCYLVSDGKNGIIIDPGCDADKILAECEGIDIQYIFLTHCHYDHVKSVGRIKEEKGAKSVSSVKCSENMQDRIKNVSYLFEDEESFPPADIVLSDGEVFGTKIGDVKCIYTPGHTDCCACFIIGEHVFTGDTLFKLNVGRWDFETGSYEALENSVRNRIYTLPDEFFVYPGHGHDTTVGYEKKYNLYIKAEK